MAAGTVSATFDARQRAGGHDRPGSRSCLGGRVLASAGHDDSVRWREGDRLEWLFERRCDWLRRQGRGRHLAVDTMDGTLSYPGLDARANQLARFLVGQGVQPGDRIGLLSDRAVDGYLGMLAVLKAHAAYVPLDPAYPPDRLSYIASDAGIRMVLSRSHLAGRAEPLAGTARLLYLDQAIGQIAGQSWDRLGAGEAGEPPDDLCYIIYTSGSTGRPKGVAIGHASICNFVRVAAEVYGMRPGDRVYQGMTVAFDFSVEEIWVPWMTGATLVPKPDGARMLGPELHAFLRDRQVTAMCCVPTLLATLDEDLPGLRFLLVSGEPCPQDLVARWHRPGRRFLNVYGPTEATVTATWTVVHPGRPVTIGIPLPTYSVVVLDPDCDRALPPGEMGEIGIAGIGLARGYVGRPELTARAFVRDFLGIPNNPGGRIYRTGDLGRVNAEGEIEHHGRIDTQVKIRGYRIELTEIESVLLRVPGIAQAVVSTYQPVPDVVELAAYYSARRDTPAVDAGQVYAELRQRLPAYMVPAYLEQLPAIPVLPSGKADRKSLPAPSGPRHLSARGGHAAPATGTERALAEVLAEVLAVDRVSVDGHFFNDLGASSLLMAMFSAAVRERGGLPPVSMKDIYLHPTVRRLAAAMGEPVSATGQPAPAGDPLRPGPAGAPVMGAWGAPEAAGVRPEAAPAARGGLAYVLCGALQLLAFLTYVTGFSLAVNAGAAWAMAGRGALQIYARLVVFGGGGLLAMGVLPVLAKWLLIGRWKPRRIRAWGPAYFRFWLVKTMVAANPLARLLLGTPLYALYLRALGARVGRRVVIFSQHVPVCTDLLTIGAGSVIRKDTYLSGYRARAGTVETGAVTIGAGVFVGEHTVLDIGTALGDGAQLGHASALLTGQAVPPGQCWHGSPAEPAGPGDDYRTVGPARCGALRRAGYSLMRLLLVLAVAGPAAAAAIGLLVSRPPLLAGVLSRVEAAGWAGRLSPATPPAWALPAGTLAITAAAFLGAILAGLVIAGTVPRLLSHALTAGRVYPLYGIHYALQRTVSRLSNAGFFNALFGDSSAIVRYLGLIGYRLAPVEQTGSNFGMEVKHEMPTLTTVGTGTMVSDGLSIINAEFSSSSFRVRPAVIGTGNFLGNGIAYPAGGRTGDNCLLATKVMIPVSGPVREGVGLLGSPCFEIPRSVRSDHQFGHLSTRRRRRHRLRAKNRHNAATIGLHLLVRWLYLAGLTLIALYLFGGAAVPGPRRTGRVGAAVAGALRATVLGTTVGDVLRTAAAIVLALAFTVGYFVLVERAVTGFRPLKPRFCSIYQPLFWRHERFWKVPSIAYIQMFSGTPFKNIVWRLLGVRVGRRVFDDGCSIVERTLVRIGREATLNAGSILQGHSLEDGTFKSGYITIGARSTVGTGAFVHYGVDLGDGAVLGADSFLMKGEHVPPGSWWRGNPAAAAPVAAPAPPGTVASPPAAAVAPSPAITLPLPMPLPPLQPQPQPPARRPAPRSPAPAHSRPSNRM
jgi:non-ribosomal peptide synthetase-like protein